MTRIIGAALTEIVAQAREDVMPLDMSDTAMGVVTVDMVEAEAARMQAEIDAYFAEWDMEMAERAQVKAEWDTIMAYLAAEGWESWDAWYDAHPYQGYPNLTPTGLAQEAHMLALVNLEWVA